MERAIKDDFSAIGQYTFQTTFETTFSEFVCFSIRFVSCCGVGLCHMWLASRRSLS